MIFARLLLGGAACLSLVACDGGLSLSGRDGGGAPVGVQIAHPAAVVLDVISVRSDDERTLVAIHVLNGRDREIKLSPRDEDSFILLDSGEKMSLIAAPTNRALAVPPGKAMDGEIVFEGRLPRSGAAVLILNERGSADSAHTSSPRFEVRLPLEGAYGGSVPEKSGLSNMRSLPASTLAPAGNGASTLGAANNAASNLEAVEKLKSDLGAIETERGTLVSLAGDVTFEFDKAAIRPAAEATLDRLAELIKAGSAGEIIVEGHTDAKGDDAYNKRLSEQRASAVKLYLTQKGVDPHRIKTIGLGELRPVAPNAKPDGRDDEEGRQRNRRVEVILPTSSDAGSKAAASES